MADSRQRIGDHYEVLAGPSADIGGSGAVWHCRDLRSGLDHSATILPLRPETQDEAFCRLLPVLDAIAQLAHPRIVAADDVVSGSGWIALITRPLPAESLRSLLLRAGPMGPAQAAQFGVQLCDALSAAHAIGVAHGRLAPSAVLLGPGADGPWTVRLNEFGVTALFHPGDPSDSESRIRAATYHAPELADDESASASSDVYSVGVLLYEALAGRPPFTGSAPAEVNSLHRSALPPPIPALADPLARLLAACLAKNPRDRPTAARVASELRAFIARSVGPAHAATRQSVAAAPKRPRRRLVEIAAAVTVGTLTAVTISVIAPKGSTAPGVVASQTVNPIVPIAVGAQSPAPLSTSSIGSGQSGTATPSPSSVTASRPPGTPGPVVPPSASTPAPIAGTGAVGRLVNAWSGKCMDTSGGYYASKVIEQIWTCNTGTNQLVTYAASGQLTEDGGAYCFEDTGGSGAAGTLVELLTCRSGTDEQWTVRSDGSIASAQAGLCVDVAAPATDDGDQLELQPCDGGTSQRWTWN